MRDRSTVFRVQLHAISGLAPTHEAPFIRVVHDDVIARKQLGKPGQVAVEFPEDNEPPLFRRRGNESTATWKDSIAEQTSPKCTAYLPGGVKDIQMQVWNRFGEDVAVHLGTTHVSLGRLRQDRNDMNGQNAMWYPVDASESSAHVFHRLRNLSVQLSITLLPRDSKTQRIQSEIRDRLQERKGRANDNTEDQSITVDPSFQFEPPSSRIEWSTIVTANVRRIFLRGDVDELQVFYNQVLHDDMEKELEEDEGLVIDDEYLSAFKLCQLSAQYLDHCVALLDTRSAEYENHSASLLAVVKERQQERRVLLDQKRRLSKELDELNLLASTYEKLLENHGKSRQTGDTFHGRLAQDQRGMPSMEPANTSPRVRINPDDVVTKKPAFLMTWEEREQSRKQQKELDKSRRIEEEKFRLQRIFQDRQDREKVEFGLSNLVQRRRERSARVIQLAFRTYMKKQRVHRIIRSHSAAIKIQRSTRGFLCRRRWPQLRPELRRLREIRHMAQCDVESHQAEELDRERRLLEQRTATLLNDEDDDQLEDGGVAQVATMDLVAMYKRLRRIFVSACRKGVSSTALFARLDSRADGVLDRAEFRAGVRGFGVRIDRAYTRALIALLRAKSDELTKPLILTPEQFSRGFDLPATVRESEETSLPRRPQSALDPEGDKTVESRSAVLAESQRIDASSEDSPVADRQASQTIEQVAYAVSELRRRILEAARNHLAVKIQSTANYHAFRGALTFAFEEFDVDGNGELDLKELVACMESINFHVTQENLVLLRECFVSDPTSQSVSISEFISFALAGASGAPEEELGVLGYRLRVAILQRVKLARRQTDSIEDAVWLVFKQAFRSKHQLTCPQRDFVRVLASLRLGFTPSQLSRLIVRLNRDGDDTISMDELLTWLRLRSVTSDTTDVQQRTTGDMATVQGGLLVREVLMELAGITTSRLTHSQRTDKAKALFRRVDTNASGKINSSELEDFLSTTSLENLECVASRRCDPATLQPSKLALQIVRLIDWNGNGVVTEEEWANFLLQDPNSGHKLGAAPNAGRFAAVEAARHGMRDAFADEPALLSWFRSIHGAICSAGSTEMKVRTREFQKAASALLPFIPARDLDEVVRVLDADSSGWVTEKEICQWKFPTRDMEALNVLITRAWTAERDSARLKDLTGDGLVDALYARFDRDGNDLIARQELRDGFRRLDLHLSEDEARMIITEFDADGDGFLGKTDFASWVQCLLPDTVSLPHHESTDGPVQYPEDFDDQDDAYSSDHEQESDLSDLDEYGDDLDDSM